MKETGIEVDVSQQKSFHMTREEFRRYGHAVVDWIADYQDRVESLPVMSRVKPGEIRTMLPENPPAQGEPFEVLLKDMDRVILPGVTHWQSPNWSGPTAMFSGMIAPENPPLRIAYRIWSTRSLRTLKFGASVRSLSRTLVDEPCVHGIGDACHGLASRHAGPPPEIPFFGQRRGSHSRYGFERCFVRAARGTRAGDELRHQQKGMRWKAGGVHLYTNAFITSESGDDCGHRRRQSAGYRGG